MLNLLIPAAIGMTAGGLAGGLIAWRLLRQPKPYRHQPSPPPDARLSAEIDHAASAWATAHGRPEASSIVADKLHLLHHLGQRQKGRRP